MIFSDSPGQIAFERTKVNGHSSRGSGVIVLHRFEYTAEMCDCRLCLYYNRKNAQSANAHVSRNESLPEQQADPR